MSKEIETIIVPARPGYKIVVYSTQPIRYQYIKEAPHMTIEERVKRIEEFLKIDNPDETLAERIEAKVKEELQDYRDDTIDEIDDDDDDVVV